MFSPSKTTSLSGKFTLFLLGIISAIAASYLMLSSIQPVQADELEDLAKQIEELEKAKQQSEAATKPLEEEVVRLQAKLANIQKSLKYIAANIIALEKSIKEREADFDRQYEVLANRVEDYYKQLRRPANIFMLFSQTSLSDITKQITYRRSVSDEDKNIISQISKDLLQLEKDKQKVEKDKLTLEQLQITVGEQSEFFQGEIDGAKAYQEELDKKIAELSARQQAILAEKSGTFQTTVGNVPLADDPASRPDYNPGFSPAFAAFSFGAPHFKGMSQYGAFGRAKSGQSYQDILKAYYGGGIEIKDHDQNAQITVEGHGSYSLEEYAKRIYEMPGSWGDEGGMEALKAQAVAARSYALARGGTICATESCQVFKPEPKGGNWEKAVNDTAGKVVYVNGQPFSTWYASTSGGYQESYSSNGYSTPGFWDTPSGRSGWTSQAYEHQAGSPWFYKGWYKSRSGDSCGRSHPWLTSEEMADILNAWKVMYQGGGDSSRITPEGSCWGDNPYSKEELRNIGGFTSVSGVNVTYSESGTTANVTFQTNKGTTTLSGSEFYKTFNLRAPGRLALKSGLFNIEKK